MDLLPMFALMSESWFFAAASQLKLRIRKASGQTFRLNPLSDSMVSSVIQVRVAEEPALLQKSCAPPFMPSPVFFTAGSNVNVINKFEYWFTTWTGLENEATFWLFLQPPADFYQTSTINKANPSHTAHLLSMSEFQVTHKCRQREHQLHSHPLQGQKSLTCCGFQEVTITIIIVPSFSIIIVIVIIHHHDHYYHHLHR